MRDYHIHTTFSDGADTPEDMVRAAIEKGIDTIGFSDHSYTFFDESYCMMRSEIPEYIRTVSELKERYAGKITVLCGIEQDYFSAEGTEGYDYIIGSVHYVRADGEYIPVDESAEILWDAVNTRFGGDVYALVEEYFSNVGDVVRKTGADIIGHFDLITKFNENGELFDTAHPRYMAAWQRAADRLLETGKVFEINTGAISRGYRRLPYPDGDMIDYIRSRGGKFILSSDSHSRETMCYGFEKYEKLIK